MKVSPNKDEENTFKPVTISITFESLEEIQEFHNIFNSIRIIDCFSHIKATPIRESLEELCGKAYSIKSFERFRDKLSESFEVE